MKRLFDRVVRWTLLAVGAALVLICLVRVLVLQPEGELQEFAHAGGQIEGQTYSNAIAALQLNYANGFRFFEMDFQQTSDGQVVCSHDWGAFFGRAPDNETFLRWRRTLTHPPCTVTELRAWFASHPDAYLISDSKADIVAINATLLEFLPDRLIAEATDKNEVCRLRELGVRRIIFASYKLDPTVEQLRSHLSGSCIAKGPPLYAVALPVDQAVQGLALAAQLFSDAPVYAHTVNHCIASWVLYVLGVDAIYTDRLQPGRCRYF